MEYKPGRREFLGVCGAGIGAFVLSGLSEPLFGATGVGSIPERMPNILWISAEDISPDLGCYGDEYARTPNIDAFCKTGVRYDRAFTTAGVCAPVRSGVITAMYASGIGTNQMRCKGVPPAEVTCFTEYLRAAGYYCTNRAKTDYQFDPPKTAWDESGGKAHWRNRPEGMPFFSVFNLEVSHESKIRAKGKWLLDRIDGLGELKHDPSKAVVPPYYPDTEVVRGDLAQYADVVTLMDQEAGGILKQLEDDGLLEDTVVFFWGDHGRGLCRCKRWVYDSGTLIPLIVRVPKKYRAWAKSLGVGTTCDEMVMSIDFGPTVLSLAGVTVPGYMDGQAFLGPGKESERKAVFAARDRMDETYDCIRSVRDGRWRYVRNFMAHLSYGQDIDYMNEMPSMKEMRRLSAEGKLKGAETQYFRKTKPVEELYDIEADPHEINNVADVPANRERVERMRKQVYDWMIEIGDVGLIPEPDFDLLKWPGLKGQVTTKPGVRLTKDGDGMLATVDCMTEGASIMYRVDKGKWWLYSEPVRLSKGQRLTVKACRIGFKDSGEVSVGYGGNSVVAERPKGDYAHWRELLDKSGILKDVLAFKELDFKGAGAIEDYFKALDSKRFAIQYWAIIGLTANLSEAKDIERAVKKFEGLLDYSSPSVRVSAAEGVMTFKPSERALKVLEKSLTAASERERLFAANSLKRLGEKVLPIMDTIKAAEEAGARDVWKVCKYIVAEFG